MPRRWHKNSTFGPGPRLAMDRERRAVWRARLHMFRRARKITPLFEDIGLALLKRLGATGQLDPSHATLADDVGCSDRSVRRAMVALKACGLAMWIQRIIRDGWRVAQTSNAYALTIADPASIPAVRCGGQPGRGTTKQDFVLMQQPIEASPDDLQKAQEALARVASSRQQALIAGWQAKRRGS